MIFPGNPIARRLITPKGIFVTPNQRASLELFEQLQPGDTVELEHEVKVGWKVWPTVTKGEVVSVERRRHGLHTKRSFDDKVYSDLIVLRKPDGELTTVTLDDFSVLKRADEDASPPTDQ